MAVGDWRDIVRFLAANCVALVSNLIENEVNGVADSAVRVIYHLDMLRNYSKWLCPKHTGYARGKFEKWWRPSSSAAPRSPRRLVL